MPARSAKAKATAGYRMKRRFRLPVGRARKLSHPRATMSLRRAISGPKGFSERRIIRVTIAFYKLQRKKAGHTQPAGLADRRMALVDRGLQLVARRASGVWAQPRAAKEHHRVIHVLVKVGVEYADVHEARVVVEKHPTQVMETKRCRHIWGLLYRLLNRSRVGSDCLRASGLDLRDDREPRLLLLSLAKLQLVASSHAPSYLLLAVAV